MILNQGTGAAFRSFQGCCRLSHDVSIARCADIIHKINLEISKKNP